MFSQKLNLQPENVSLLILWRWLVVGIRYISTLILSDLQELFWDENIIKAVFYIRVNKPYYNVI